MLNSIEPFLTMFGSSGAAYLLSESNNFLYGCSDIQKQVSLSLVVDLCRWKSYPHMMLARSQTSLDTMSVTLQSHRLEATSWAVS